MKLLTSLLILYLFGFFMPLSAAPSDKFFYATADDVLKIAERDKDKLSSHNQALQEMLRNVGFVKKEDGDYVLNTLPDLKYNTDKLILFSFKYNKENDTHVLSGKYKIAYTAATVRFMALYKSEELQLMHYTAFADDGIAQIFDDGKYGLFSAYDGLTIIGLEHPSYVTFLPPKDFFIEYKQIGTISKDGRYYVGLLKSRDENDQTDYIALYNIKKSSFVTKFGIKSSKKSSTTAVSFDFSQDSRYLIYKVKNTPFKVYDLELQKEVESFGLNEEEKSPWAEVIQVGDYSIASFFDSDKEKGTKTSHMFVYNTATKKMFCDIEGSFGGMYMFLNDKQNFLYAINSYKNEVFSLQEGDCVKVDTQKNEKDIYNELSTDLGYHQDGKQFLFKNGKIESITFNQPEITPEGIEASKKIFRIKRLFLAGFEQKALAKLKTLIEDEEYDVFNNHYYMLSSFLKGGEHFYFNLLAMNRYIKRNERVKDFYRTVVSSLFMASMYGFKELETPIIEKYEKAISVDATKYEKDLLTILKANYLLDIGKDKEAYEMLFDTMPLDKEVLKQIKHYSPWKHGLMKDRAKLVVALELKESDLKKTADIKNVVYLYDFDGHKVHKDEKSKLYKAEEKALTPKQEAIKLLD